MNPRVVFMGSPYFAVPSLRKLAESYPVVGVVTQPDRPAGRGRLLTPPPVKLLAQEMHLPVIQPTTLRQPEELDLLSNWHPDLIVVAAYGQILRPEVLDLPDLGCLNVHASLLPRWRGAAPVQAALLHGDTQTGATIMLMDAGTDTGPILRQRAIEINQEDNAASLGDRLASLGAELLIDTLPDYLNGDVKPFAQDNSLVTYAPRLRKEDGELDFHQPAVTLMNQVRAFNPWPGAYTMWKNQMLKIHQAKAEIVNEAGCTLSPGHHAVIRGPGKSEWLPAVHTSIGLLVLTEVQPAGKKTMSGEMFLQGAKDWA